MADNTPQTGTDTIATDDLTSLNGGAVSGVKAQRTKTGWGVDGTFNDVSATNPLPVNLMASASAATQTSGSITAVQAQATGTTSTTGQVVADVSSMGNVTFHLIATAFVGTVSFEATLDSAGTSTTWSPWMSNPEDGQGPSVNSLSINTASAFIRTFTSAAPGPRLFKIRASAFTSGTLTVVIQPGPTLIEPNPALAPSLSQIGSLRPSDLAVTVTAAISTAATLTLPAVAGQFHHITSLTLQRIAGAALTGAAAPTVVTSTNLPGSMAWSFDTAGAIGTSQIQPFYFDSSPLKSSAVNTATTIIAPLTTSVIWRLSATYFTAI